jgi:metallo-beta-lactamase class B
LPRHGIRTSRRDDQVVSDGQKLTLGDTTLTFTLTPGHTPGTVSTLIPVKDNGTPHLVAEWGGTGFNFPAIRKRSRPTPHPPLFRDVAGKAGADAFISNHTNLDGSKTKMPALAMRKPGDPHPRCHRDPSGPSVHDRRRRMRAQAVLAGMK